MTISTHAPAGGATRQSGWLADAQQISTHAPAGGATIKQMENEIDQLFLLTPLREGRLGGEPLLEVELIISTHAPAGGATNQRRISHGVGKNFYSRPCGRGDLHFFLRIKIDALISTHAPAGGATRVVVIRSQLAHISTHAPAGGATTGGSASLTSELFLLTPLREGRRSVRRNLSSAR